MKKALTLTVLAILMLTSGCGSERSQTEKLLGVSVNDFPAPQGVNGFDEVPENASEFKFTFLRVPFSGAKPKPWYESVSSVYASAPDGTLWEAFCGYAGAERAVSPELDTRPDALTRPKLVDPYNGFVSSPKYTRQSYSSHLGYAFSPKDIFIGKREGSRLKTVLFFRDVGSHTTAPHDLAIDNSGDAHLVVADVNISDNNSLDLYWFTGSLITGKWTSAWQIDKRGFTSSSHPWNKAWGEKVLLLWHWDTGERQDSAMGLYHVERTASGFARKVRIFTGRTDGWRAVVDPKSGLLLVAVPSEDGVYLISKQDSQEWSRPTKFPVSAKYRPSLLLELGTSEDFVLKVSLDEGVLQFGLIPQI